jgi:hypothetical protein
MKALSVVLLFILGLAAPAAAGQYKLENRPEVVFKGGIVHQSPYPQSKRAASVWASDACWRDCKTSCTWKMEYCVGSNDPDACRPHLDACDRSCQRSCRGLSAGPLFGFFDF